MTQPFDPKSPEDIARLIEGYPLAWLISDQFHASPLPLIAERDESGTIVSLFGHCGRRNPLVADFRATPRGLILFNGPDGYISPGLISQPDWAPTWNYAVLRFTVEVELVEHETRDAIERLVTAMEGNRWSTAELGPRYDQLLEHIIAFRAHVRSTEHSFKLGQDESAASFAEIVEGHQDRTLASWMEDQSKR